MTLQELQSLRNWGDLGEDAADTIERQAEHIRVLTELLPKVMNYASCDYDSSFRPHFDHVMERARAVLAAGDKP